ncbi:hypothetical protein KCP70_16560 [Salmonella enterica subsp. enterica]|nr:hypothetical protein KCP70_16560 [Salmonella enterica subsp. enterica]
MLNRAITVSALRVVVAIQTGRRCWRFVSLRRLIRPNRINLTAFRTEKWAGRG